MLDDARRPSPAPGSVGLGEKIRIPAEDGRPLAASIFLPPGSAPGNAPLTVIAGGTGIARRYYARIAAYLAENGRPTVTFDYRETGGSRPASPPASPDASLRASQVRMRDWCILDAAGVIAWAAREHPARPLHWVGHSLGGFATGLAHNNRLITRQLSIATLSGYWRHMAVPERYRVRVLMGAVAPLIIRIRGYFPGPLIGGEDMPGPAFLEWRRWCMQPGFLFDDTDLPEIANFARFHAPIRFAQIEDDTWGTPAAVEAMARRFTGSADRTIWHIRRADARARRIGHHGFFRPSMRDTLWPAALAWLNGTNG
ncbi:MAG TPA: alpha/beta fold hydrolase [Hyphomicrobiaceae bacterium]|nr:alpha/beta fold hydrolase [Hyphomicrobiaceae bacterium]